MDIRDLSWEVRPGGDTLMQQIEALGEKVGVPSDRRRDIRWLAENLRSITSADNRCEAKVLLNYVQTAMQQGIDFLDGE